MTRVHSIAPVHHSHVLEHREGFLVGHGGRVIPFAALARLDAVFSICIILLIRRPDTRLAGLWLDIRVSFLSPFRQRLGASPGASPVLVRDLRPFRERDGNTVHRRLYAHILAHHSNTLDELNRPGSDQLLAQRFSLTAAALSTIRVVPRRGREVGGVIVQRQFHQRPSLTLHEVLQFDQGVVIRPVDSLITRFLPRVSLLFLRRRRRGPRVRHRLRRSAPQHNLRVVVQRLKHLPRGELRRSRLGLAGSARRGDHRGSRRGRRRFLGAVARDAVSTRDAAVSVLILSSQDLPRAVNRHGCSVRVIARVRD